MNLINVRCSGFKVKISESVGLSEYVVVQGEEGRFCSCINPS